MDFKPAERVRYELRRGDILLSEASGSASQVGKPAIWNGELALCCFQNTVIRLRPRGVEPRYLLWLFTHFFRNGIFAQVAGGVGINHLSAAKFSRLVLPIAPTSEQGRIVAEIEKQFTRLEFSVGVLRRVLVNLGRYRAAIYGAACDGNLLSASATRERENGPSLLRSILLSRRNQWNRKRSYREPEAAAFSDEPVVPAGWTWATIDQLSFIDVGFAFKSAEFEEAGIRLLRGENIEPGRLRWTDTRYLSEDKVLVFRHLMLETGDIVLAMDRPIVSAGLKIARVRPTDLPCLLVQRMARFRPVVSEMTPYLYIALNTEHFRKHLRAGQTGTQLPHISGARIQSFPVPLPPLAQQSQIVAEVDQRLSVADEVESIVQANLERADRLRKSILERAFVGQLI